MRKGRKRVCSVDVCVDGMQFSFEHVSEKGERKIEGPFRNMRARDDDEADV